MSGRICAKTDGEHLLCFIVDLEKLEMGWRIRCYDIYILTGKNGERREKKKVEQFAECYMNKRLEL